MDTAVAFVVAMQEAAGVDIISDGEWRRLSYIGVIADICDGFEVGYRGQQPWTLVVDKITPCARRAWSPRRRVFVRDHTRCEPKVALPSPYLLGQRMWDADRSRGAYADARGVHVGAGAGAARRAGGDSRRRAEARAVRRSAPVPVRRRARAAAVRRSGQGDGPVRRADQRRVEGLRRPVDGHSSLPPQQGPPGLGGRRGLRADPGAPGPAER